MFNQPFWIKSIYLTGLRQKKIIFFCFVRFSNWKKLKENFNGKCVEEEEEENKKNNETENEYEVQWEALQKKSAV